MTRRTIGFIGLGMMGAPMSRRLAAAGHALLLRDADPERAAGLRRELHAGELTRATAGSLDLLITMLPDSAAVESALLDGGWGDALAAGATVIDMSSSEPVRSRALAERLAGKGLGYLDAPVSGGVRRAVDGTLAILVGGDAALLARWQPVLAAMGSSVLHIGPTA